MSESRPACATTRCLPDERAARRAHHERVAGLEEDAVGRPVMVAVQLQSGEADGLGHLERLRHIAARRSDVRRKALAYAEVHELQRELAREIRVFVRIAFRLQRFERPIPDTALLRIVRAEREHRHVRPVKLIRMHVSLLCRGSGILPQVIIGQNQDKAMYAHEARACKVQ